MERKLKSSISLITKLQTEVNIDSIVMHDTVILKQDGTITAPFQYSDNWVSLSGHTHICEDKSSTEIERIKMDVPLTVGVTKDNTVFVKTENPYVTLHDIQSAALNNKKKKWNVGIQAGIGAQYDLLHKQIGIGPYIGIGVAYGFDF